MKAVICKKFAPVSDLVWEEVADPVAGPGEIVIDVKAAGLNYPDILLFRVYINFNQKDPFLPDMRALVLFLQLDLMLKCTALETVLRFLKASVLLQKKL